MSQAVEQLTHEEAVERVKHLASKIKSRFLLTEELGRQPQETIQEFIVAGLIRAMVPKRWGVMSWGLIPYLKPAWR